MGLEFTKFGYENDELFIKCSKNLSKISHYLSNLWTNISIKKQLYQAKKWYLVTICINLIQNRPNSLCLTKYCRYLSTTLILLLACLNFFYFFFHFLSLVPVAMARLKPFTPSWRGKCSTTMKLLLACLKTNLKLYFGIFNILVSTPVPGLEPSMLGLWDEYCTTVLLPLFACFKQMFFDIFSPGANVIKLFTAAIYCCSTVIPSLCVI